MLQEKIKINHPRGIHLKPATMIAQFCLKNQDLDLTIHKNELVARGDSVMSILSLELTRGSEITISISQNNPEAILHVKNILDGKIT